MSARDEIFAALRANRPPGVHELPEVPRFGALPEAERLPRFAEALARMGGTLLPQVPEDPLAPLRALLAGAGPVCSVVPELRGDVALSGLAGPGDLAGVDVAIVRAAFGVAETGSVLLTDAALRVNALAYLAQRLVVLLDPAKILAGIHQAYDHPALRAGHYTALHTGPSATADIEGVLVQGAQGVRALHVLLLPAPGAIF